MTVYKRGDVWWYEFEIEKTRFRASAKTANKREAQAIEAERRREAIEDQKRARLGVKRMAIKDVADKWLEVSAVTHKDHANNVSRVRKLFGDELKQQGKEWALVADCRPGLPKTLMVHEITQEHLTALKAARLREKNSAGTINREISLVQALLGYAASLKTVMPAVPIVWAERRNRAASLKMKESKGETSLAHTGRGAQVTRRARSANQARRSSGPG